MEKNSQRIRLGLFGLLCGGLSFGGIFWGIQLTRLSPGNPLPIWIWPAAAAGAFVHFQFWRMRDRRAQVASLAFSFAFLFFQILGSQLDVPAAYGQGATAGDLASWLSCAGCAALLSPLPGWPAALILKRLEVRKPGIPAPFHFVKSFLICAGILFLAWQPCHLAYFPLLAEYDSGYQFWQSWNHLYNASNPLLHTLILGFFYLTGEQLGSVTCGLAVLGAVQQAMMAACISYALTILRRNGAPRGAWIGGMAFFAVFPVFGMMSISMTKDIPYYSLTLVQMAMIWDGVRREEVDRRRGYWIGLTIVTVVACLMRANALPAMFAIGPLLAVLCRRREFRRRLICFLTAGVAIAIGINEGLIALLKADRPLMRESLSVPIMQIARVSVYHEEVAEDLTENEKDIVEMPMVYIPLLADLSKWAWNVDSGNLGRFFGIWWKYFQAYPQDYVDAFLLLNRGYWDLWDTSYSDVYGKSAELHLGVIPSRVTANIETIHEHCFFPALKEHMEQLYSANEYLNIPVWRKLFSPALYVWMAIFALTAAIFLRRRDVRIPARTAMLFLAALMLGPCCILRYALVFMMMGPAMIIMLVCPKAEENT